MSKRDKFWQSLPVDDSEFESVQWPEDLEARSSLAARIVGATFVGALDHIAEKSLSRVNGVAPEPGSHDYQRTLASVGILQTLTPEQRAAVAELIRETAYFAAYWPLAKLRNLPSLSVDLNMVPLKDDEPLEPITLNEIIDLHAHLQSWIEEFSDILAK